MVVVFFSEDVARLLHMLIVVHEEILDKLHAALRRAGGVGL